MKNMILFFLCFNSLFGQAFQISNIGQRQFTLNRFDKIVYAMDDFTGQIYEYDLKNNTTKESTFPSLPYFANNSRKAVYYKERFLYLYDLDKNTTTPLGFEEPFAPYISFSPNDKCLIFGSDLLKCAFLDSIGNKMITIGYANILGLHPNWLNDSTIVYVRSSSDLLYRYNIYSKKQDSIIDLSTMNQGFLGFDYNIKLDAIAYSYEYISNKRILLHDLKTNSERVIVDFARDFPTYSHTSPFGFKSLKWSPDCGKLTFIGHYFTINMAGIFTYYLDSNKTKIQIKLDDYGAKSSIEWLNKDTIIFANMSLFKINGFSVPGIYTSINKSVDDIVSNYMLFQNYPNPFNPSTLVNYQIKEKGFVSLKVYDILGREVKTLVNEEKDAGFYSVRFDAGQLTSGIYFYKLMSNSFSQTKKMFLTK